MSTTTQKVPPIPGFYSHSGVAPECLPYAHFDGNDKVIVFFHGLTGSPNDFRAFVEPYREAGYDVVVPLIPGHGSHISYLERLTYRELFLPFQPIAHYLMARYKTVHYLGLSYGAVLTTDLALRVPPKTISYLAPAFFLTHGSEGNMRVARGVRLHAVKGRIAKKSLSKDKTFNPHPFTYSHIPFLPATELHARAQEVMGQIRQLQIPAFHAHGDCDDTTPQKENYEFLRKSFEHYTFLPVRGGLHVLPLFESWATIARLHIQWLGDKA